MTDQNREVAEKVMGWTWRPAKGLDFYGQGKMPAFSAAWLDQDDVVAGWENWNPCNNIADAWMVVERMRELGHRLHLEELNNGWKALFYENGYKGRAIAETAPLAIVKAALAAVEGE